MPLKQWTIEGRCNTSDEALEKVIKELFQTAAVRLQASITLVAENGNPQVVCFSNDFFTGVNEIQAVAKEAGPSAAAIDQDQGVSHEMIDALKQMSGQ